MRDVLTQVWLKSINLLDNYVNAQKESLKNTSRVHTSSRKPTKKVCDENERNKEKMMGA